jgi:hypothetical protein
MARNRSRGRSSGKNRRSRPARFLAVVGIAGLALLAVLITGEKTRRAAVRERNLALLSAHSEPAADVALASDASERPVYPHSIVPGGAATVEELKAAIDTDPVVASHFSNFDLGSTRVETLKDPKIAHVSYRQGNEVFWTRKPVLIRAGEKVLTDGENIARTRCANQLSDEPGPVSVFEPAAAVLDTPDSQYRVIPPTAIVATNGSPRATPGDGTHPPGAPPSGNTPGAGTPGAGTPGATTPGPGATGVGTPGGSTGSPTDGDDGPPADPGDPGNPPGNGGNPPGNGGNPPGNGGNPPGNGGNPPGNGGNPPGNGGNPPGNGNPPSVNSQPEDPGMPPGNPFAPTDPQGDPLGPPDDPISPGDPQDPGDPDDPTESNTPGDPGDPGDPNDPSNDPATVPEPATTILMLAGGAYALRRRVFRD